MYLHEEKGLNPRLTKCPRCGEGTNELILLGRDNTLYDCHTCHRYYIGNSLRCPNCETFNTEALRELGDNERVPHSLCKKCETERNKFEKELELGGVLFKCDCGTAGIIKHTPNLAQETERCLR